MLPAGGKNVKKICVFVFVDWLRAVEKERAKPEIERGSQLI